MLELFLDCWIWGSRSSKCEVYIFWYCGRVTSIEIRVTNTVVECLVFL
jgi:hypothetical protein